MTKPFLVLYGVPGTGKTTEALTSFQDSLYIGSALNNTHFYKNWLKSPEGQASGLRPPKNELVIDQFAVILDGKRSDNFDKATKKAKPMSQTMAVKQYAEMAVDKSNIALTDGKPPPWNYVIFDEMSTFLSRCFQEISPTVLTKEGKHNSMAAYVVMADWTASLVNYLRQLIAAEVGVCFICHDQEPDTASDRKGGPKAPSQAIMKQICAEADGVLQRVLEDPPLDINNPNAKRMARRLWRAHGSQHHMSKLRGLPDSMFEEIQNMKLREIVGLAGFEA